MPIIPNINNQSIAILSDIESWKEDIADAINSRGGVADASESFQDLAEDITQIPSTGIFSNGVELDNTFSFLKYVTSNINNEIVSINDNTITEITRFYAFFNNIALREVVMSRVTTISGSSTFYNCSSLQSVELPNLTTISGSSTFYNCSSLQSVELPNLTTISGSNTFYDCSSLQNVELPNLTTISESSTFYNCYSLQNVELPNLTTISGSSTFYNRSSLQSVELPNLTTISGIGTFYNCSSLQSVELPNLTTISGSSTFYNCYSLQNVELPNLTTISGSGTFYNCSSLQNVELGVLIQCSDPFLNVKQMLRNITIGLGTDINLPFQEWTATAVVAEEQSGIDELNSNLYNNLLTMLYDHSNDGETRILQIGWLDYVTPENIAYATAKGWTLTT